ncbi:MAG: sugar phosphate isomerase/epimerase [Lentisphaeria bacterium]|nr:sugar phosphate isomerase/epimerase [Lentisphaeria bacterium]
MQNIPRTNFFHIEYVPKELQRVFLREYTANGAKHIALSDAMILNIMANANDRIFYKELVEEAGITYKDAHAPFGKFLDLNCPLLHKEKILRARLAMEITADFGIDTITFHVGGPVHEGYTTDELHEEAVRTVEKLLPYAEKLNMTFCIENVCNTSATAERLTDIKEHFISDDTLGFCFDSGHAHLAACREALAAGDAGKSEELEIKILEKMLPHTVVCHLHDNDGTIDNHRIPGNGTTNWKKLLPVLAKAPRLKCIQNECSEPFQKEVSSGTSIKTMLENFDSILQYMQ